MPDGQPRRADERAAREHDQLPGGYPLGLHDRQHGQRAPDRRPHAALGAGVASDTVMGRLVGPGPSKGLERAWFAKP